MVQEECSRIIGEKLADWVWHRPNLVPKLSLEKQKGAGHARFIILVKDVCLLRETKVLSTVGNISRFTKDQHNCDLEDRLERDHSGC